MSNQQEWRRRAGQGQRQVQISPALLTGGGAGCFRNALLTGLNRVNLGAHHCPVNLVIVQQRRASEIAAVFQIGVQHPLGERRGLARAQVHGQKRQIVHYVNPAEIVIKLDAVENHDLAALGQHHIAQMQIAVALADPSAGLAFRQQRAQSAESAQGPAFHIRQRGELSRIDQQRSGMAEIVQHRLLHPLRCSQ